MENNLHNSDDVVRGLVKTAFWKSKLLCHSIWERCNNKNDVIMFINGGRGKGKSTAGVFLLRYYLETFFGKTLNKKKLQENVVYSRDALIDRAKNLPLGEPILIDEGIFSAYSLDFAKKEVKDLVKFFAVCRTKRRFIIWVSPNFTELSGHIRRFCYYRLRMVERGLAVLFKADEREGVDPFHIDQLKDIEKYHNDTSDVEQVVNGLKRHSCYSDVLSFGALPSDLQEWYDEYRDKSVYEDSGVSDSVNDKAMMILYNLKSNWGKLCLNPKLTLATLFDKVCRNSLTGDLLWQSPTHFRTMYSSMKKQVELKNKLSLSKSVEVEGNSDEVVEESSVSTDLTKA